jgi:hypothetical protein
MDSNHKSLNPLPPLEVLVDDENECLQPAVGQIEGRNPSLTPCFVSWGPTRQFVNALGHIFSKYCTPAAVPVTKGVLMKPPANAYLTEY